jgi:hypothetical protein
MSWTGEIILAMSSQDQSPRELAKQGDPKAIADAINNSLKSKGIKADVMRDNGCLHVMMEGDQVPNHQKDLVKLVRNGMDRLGVQTIYTVRVYGRQFGDEPQWEEEIVLRTPPEPPITQTNDIHSDESSVPLVDEEDQDYNIDDEIIDDEYISDDDEDEYLPPINSNPAAAYNPEEDDDPDDDIEETTRQVEPKKPKSKVLPLILLGGLALVLVLAGLHFTGIFRLPFLPAGSPESTSDTPSTPTTDRSPKPAASPAVTADPFSEAVKTAITAANLAQKAQTKADWTKIAAEWKQASELMQKVPKSHPKFTVAQDRAVQYANNQKIAQQKATAAPN